jgi:hypothetical protein
MITKRMPSSIREKAQSSMEPKATGVKISKRTRVIFMTVFNIFELPVLDDAERR